MSTSRRNRFRTKAEISDRAQRLFWKHVQKTESCWLWTASKNSDGYGMAYTGEKTLQIGAHRMSWVIHRLEIPSGIKVLHKCDNPACVNPDHLFLGTDADNMKDMVNKGRQRFLAKAKLTRKDVGFIRRESANLRKRLAKQFGVNVTTICRAITGRRWNHNYVR